MKKHYLILIAIVVIALALLDYSKKSANSPSPLDSFATCLAERGAIMYGADWCPHCQNEKRAFGSSFRFVPYIECPQNPKECIAKGIDGYPTWIFSDGRIFVGEQGLNRLSEISGCTLPK